MSDFRVVVAHCDHHVLPRGSEDWWCLQWMLPKFSWEWGRSCTLLLEERVCSLLCCVRKISVVSWFVVMPRGQEDLSAHDSLK